MVRVANVKNFAGVDCDGLPNLFGKFRFSYIL